MPKRKKFHRSAAQSEDSELASILKKIDEMPTDDSLFSKFTDFPLSTRTQKGLRRSGYAIPTAIQRASLRLGLQGRDVLGASKTGSGKTLAFLIPILERLWREKWSRSDGLGALIITPTRELAYQIFQVLRKVGFFHEHMNAGMVTGGMDFAEEGKRITNTNIIVCTPGRLLQHMDETPDFRCDSLQVLVLDEADRILDMGFSTTVNALVDNLPTERQTMLFSATQTKSVRRLANLSLTDPEYVAVDEAAQHSTPKNLTQVYMEVNVEDKLMALYSFIRTNPHTKAIVFLSCCKQVKFAYECFRKLRPAVPLLALHGRLKQIRRSAIYNDFRNKQYAYLLATDIAARGLDFPAVNWVIQMDCPEDVDTYIHRVGRTARYEKDGQSLIMLTPSEKDGMLKALEKRKVPIDEARPDPKKLMPITQKLAGFCSADQEIMRCARRAFVCYVKSVYIQPNKEIFDVSSIPLQSYATSLGLSVTPNVRIVEKAEKKRQAQAAAAASGVEARPAHSAERPKLVRQEALDVSDSDSGSEEDSDDDDNDDTLLKPRKTQRHLDEECGKEMLKDVEKSKQKASTKVKTKVQAARSILKKPLAKTNSHVVYGEDGEVESSVSFKAPAVANPGSDDLGHLQPVPLGEEDSQATGGLDLVAASREMRGADRLDRLRHKQRVKEMHKEQRRKEREENRREVDEDGDDEDAGVQLGARLGGESDEGASSASEDESPPPTKRRKAAVAKRTKS
ncbi:probable ATP-dependent RNA helicase DDX10 isoform X1 [Sycon ciliatum]|uniref:probable ATP-dependent RNA helicase DDX10 isoform X1 n=1 Tax=Sycon ciliatum TaxID=27933 RepID=UPI0031F66DF8